MPFPEIMCPRCGGSLVCSDMEEHGGPKAYCPKCDLYEDELFAHYHSSKPKANETVEIDDIKILKMLKALDDPIRLEIVNFILSKQGEDNE